MVVATWNLENLFRPGNDAGPSDQQVYEAKLAELARVIGQLAPDVLGIQEVGDPEALEDLRARLDGDWHAETSEFPDGRGTRVGFPRLRMKFGRNFMPAYNAQAVTTSDQIIVAAEITTKGGDFEELDPMISAAERELATAGVEERPGVVLADAGYWSNEHIDSLRVRGMIPIVAADTTRSRPRKDRLGGPYDFMRRVIASEAGGGLYSKRQCMVEPVFAQIKANRRIDRFKRRGRAAARSEWRLIAATHNLLKLHRHQLAAATA